MVAIGPDDVEALFLKITEQFVTLQGAPEGKLWLEIYSQVISGFESGLRGAPGVESHMVDTISGAFAKIIGPCLLVHRGMSCQGEDASVMFSSEEYLMTSSGELPVGNLQPRHRLSRFCQLIRPSGHTQLNLPDNSVPIGLCVLGIHVGTPDDPIRNTSGIVHHDLNRVEARLQMPEIVFLGSGNVILCADLLSVQEQSGSFGALQEQDHIFP